jgi:hypothetical protein
MASALREHANRYDVTIIETTGHGGTYRVVGVDDAANEASD